MQYNTIGQSECPAVEGLTAFALTRQSFTYYTSVGYLSCSQYQSGNQVITIDLPSTLYRYDVPSRLYKYAAHDYISA